MRHDPPRGEKGKASPLAKIFLNALAIFLLYSGIAVILNYFPLKTRLPLTRAGQFLFHVFPVFSSYQEHNLQFVLFAWVVDTTSTKPLGWVRLDIPEYFPHKDAENRMRLAANIQRFYDPVKGQTRAHKSLSRKIRARYNSLNAHTPFRATRIAIGTETWPASPRSFYALKTPENTIAVTFYLEEP